jgi:protein CpxP
MRKFILPAIAAVTLSAGAALAQGTMTSPPPATGPSMNNSTTNDTRNDPSTRGDRIGNPGSPTPQPQRSPGSAQTTNPGSMSGAAATQTDAKQRIEAQGYTAVRDLKQDNSKNWHAKAMKDGKSVDVSLDSRGNVRAGR